MRKIFKLNSFVVIAAVLLIFSQTGQAQKCEIVSAHKTVLSIDGIIVGVFEKAEEKPGANGKSSIRLSDGLFFHGPYLEAWAKTLNSSNSSMPPEEHDFRFYELTLDGRVGKLITYYRSAVLVALKNAVSEDVPTCHIFQELVAVDGIKIPLSPGNPN